MALIGNKHIAHHKNRSVSIELTHGEPELRIEEKNGGYHLSLSHWLSHAWLIIEPESMTFLQSPRLERGVDLVDVIG